VCFVICCQGTNVASGKARGVVIGTGQNTEIGRIEYSIDYSIKQTDYTLRSIVVQN